MKNKEVKNELNEIKRVALYIRVSTDRQAKEGESLEAQEDALYSYCKERNYIVVDKYIDGGETGQKIKRTNFQRMMEDVKANKIDLILMTKLDRWFRNIADFYKIIETIQKHNVDWKTIWEDFDTTTASGQFWLNISLSIGQLEAQRTSERINEIFNHKYHVQKTVCTGMAPYGYKIENKKLVVDEEKAKNIVALFEHYKKTNNLNETANWFRTNCENKSTTVIKKYLRNPIYIGKFRTTRTKEIIEDFAPRIISDDLWKDVQRLIQINVKNNKGNPNAIHHNSTPYIFTGLLVCKECGHILSGKANTGGIHYYNCRYNYFKKCENNKCINERKLEKYLLDNIVSILEQKKLEIIEINSKKVKIVDNTQMLKTKLKKLADLYLNNMIDIDYYKESYENISAQINKIEEQKNINTKIDYSYIDDFLKIDFLTYYDKLDNLDKRRFWASIIESIEIKGYDDIKVNVY